MTDLVKKLGEMMERTRKAEARVAALTDALVEWGEDNDADDAVTEILRKADASMPTEAFLAKMRAQ